MENENLINPATGKIYQPKLGKILGITVKNVAYFARKGMPMDSVDSAKTWLAERRKAHPPTIKFDPTNPNPNHPRIRFLPQIREMLASGLSINKTARALHISTFSVRAAAQENNISYQSNVINVMDEQPWQVGDPKTLTDDQRELCQRLTIKPERMAWLVSCPKGGQPTRL